MRRTPRSLLLVANIVGVLAAGCAGDAALEPTQSQATQAEATQPQPTQPQPTQPQPTQPQPTQPLPSALRLLRGVDDPLTEDVIEVWICRVPAETRFEAYLGLELRLDLSPQQAVDIVTSSVPDYFLTLSNGRYAPTFVAGGEIEMADDDTPNRCVDSALDRSAPTTNAVLAIANAEHNPSSSGGWGRPASVPCSPPVTTVTTATTVKTRAVCSAARSRRAAYVGASDFHPSWGGRHPMDLVEHELGHTLDWPHSGAASEPAAVGSTDAETGHANSLDLMSNSAARREADPSAVDAQGTLAANLVAAGWLPLHDIEVVPPEGTTIALAPSASASGPRVAVVELDEHRLLTIEYRPAAGLDSFLPAGGGVSVHLVDQSPAACNRPAGDGRPCTGIAAANVALVGTAPFTDLLVAGETWAGEGWLVAVSSLSAARAEVRVAPQATGG